MKQKFEVTGMGCSACVARVEKAVKALPGVANVSVSLIENSMICEFDEKSLSEDDITKAVEEAGYGASPVQEEKEEKPKKKLFS